MHGVVAVGAALISVAYIIVIPRYLGNVATSSALIVGLGLVASGSGYIATRQFAISCGKAVSGRWS